MMNMLILKKIKIYWMNNKNEIIFQDKMNVKDFIDLHQVCPHKKKFRYCDVIIKRNGL